MTKPSKLRRRAGRKSAAAEAEPVDAAPAAWSTLDQAEAPALLRPPAGVPTDGAADAFDALAPLSSRALFWRARHVAPSPFLGALPLLFWLIETARPRSVAVLGLNDTVPFLGACQAVERLGLDCLCVGLSLPPSGDRGEGGGAEADDQVPEAIRTAIHDQYADFAQTLPATRAGSGSLAGVAVDLLIIARPVDAHLAEALQELWLPSLSARATVLFSHGAATGFEAGFRRLVRRLSASHGEFRFAPDRQATLIPLGSDQPDRLRRLAGLRVGHSSYLMARHVFARLGEANERIVEACRESDRGLAAERDRDALRTRLDQADAALTDKTALADTLADQLAAKSSQVATVQAQTFDAERAAEAAHAEAEKLRAELAAREEALATQLSEVAAARDTAHAEAEKLRAELAVREEDIAVLGQQLKARAGAASQADAAPRKERDVHTTLARLQPVRDRIQAALARPRLSRTHRAQRRALDADLTLIAESELFDADWYRRRYPDVEGTALSPEEHFVRLGAYEGRSPGPRFDSLAYHGANRDVAEAGHAALMHYLRYGRAEGRKIFAVVGDPPPVPSPGLSGVRQAKPPQASTIRPPGADASLNGL